MNFSLNVSRLICQSRAEGMSSNCIGADENPRSQARRLGAVMQRHAVATYLGLRGRDRGTKVADLVMHVVQRPESFGPREGDVFRCHGKRGAAHHRSHVERERIGETGLERRPVALVGGDEHADDGVFDCHPGGERIVDGSHDSSSIFGRPASAAAQVLVTTLTIVSR